MTGRLMWIILLLMQMAAADIYLHIPRGSNNRINEQSANRNNANRMFDSQNNNRGGYNVGDAGSDPAGANDAKQYQMKYFMSGGGNSYLDVEWTNQHGCGGSEDEDPHKQNCQLVLQFMCQEESISASDDDKIRAGTSTQTQDYNGPQGATENYNQKENRKNGNVKRDRGLNEPWEWYDSCYTRERNKGLFTADQKLKRNNGDGVSAATYTRQNPGDNRYAYECPEERDYYPYWHPTPWIDIAILTDNTSLCEYYKSNSFNVRSYGRCVEQYSGTNRVKHASKYNNPSACEQEGHNWVEFYNYLEKDTSLTNQADCESKSTDQLSYRWLVPFDVYDESDSPTEECLLLPPPLICEAAPWSRSNHLGNGIGGLANTYRWTIPYFPSNTEKRCALRLRYNISTDDYDPWNTNASFNTDLGKGAISPVQQNPYVDIGADTTALRLAINTAQFGRTFQDRSHPFVLRPRPAEALSQTIYNINVRGKRGNIVQVYPAVEYDFAPTNLVIGENDLVHFQWTGSNTHNNGNPAGDGQVGDAGEGRRGTDRSNVAEMADLLENFPVPYENSTLWKNSEVIWMSEALSGGNSLSAEDLAVSMSSAGYFKCVSAATCGQNSLERKAAINNLLDNAPASYEAPLIKLKAGTYYYMCTRNNNFSNRSQKGSVVVLPGNQ
ncbi:protein DD3-3-like [Watersipora subatra]|uniref:protein DD3-3-like n=1 Tax=Watersipora subatra TaxID=2589382 RepID=UPI00355C3FAF